MGDHFATCLDRDIRLSLSQAAQLGTEVAQGLAYAHLRGLVHRDIKPANLLFDEEGRVRVADFGVARALAEAAWTEPAGAMIGTARYISPEAAEGKPVDGRADVYSLALVLYEAVTGVVPFVTDTTMGTLAARIGQPLPHNDLLGPLDDVLARAAAPDVATRLDAAGLAARLGALASALPTPSPLPLITPKIEGSASTNGFRAPGVSELTDSGLTLAAGVAAGTTVGDGTAIAPGLAGGTPIGTKAGPGELFDAEPSGEGRSGFRRKAKTTPLSSGGPPEPYRPKKSRKWWWIGAAVLLAAILAAGLVDRLRDECVHRVASDAFSGESAVGAGRGGGGQGPYEPEAGRTGHLDNRRCR